MIIGLTGPIGSGKSTVAKTLYHLGCHIIDADRLGHMLFMPQSSTWGRVVKAFGSRVLMRGGAVNRKKLAEIVFADPKKLKLLNSIMHPRMKEIITREAKDALASVPGRPVVISAAVLKEMGLVPLVDQVWLVTSSKENRVRRLKKKKFSDRQIAQRLRAQTPEKELNKIADIVIKNDASLLALKKQVRELMRQIRGR